MQKTAYQIISEPYLLYTRLLVDGWLKMRYVTKYQ